MSAEGPVPVDKTAIRNAATVIVLRGDGAARQVLMGQRGASAAFMPSKFVFPGGAVDAEDAAITLARPIDAACATRLEEESAPGLTDAICVAAIRELWEETGLILGRPGRWAGPVPADWQGFAEAGYLPDASALRFVFRALTPPGRPRRFDARFFMIEASRLSGDLDDFSRASEELSHLQWVPLAEARSFDLPFVTEVVLAEIAHNPHPEKQIGTVPFFRNRAGENLILALGEKSQLTAGRRRPAGEG